MKVLRGAIILQIVFNICHVFCNCPESKITWSLNGELELIQDISSSENCFQQCFLKQDQGCLGYTWYGVQDRLENVCILFSSLDDPYDCENCASNKFEDGFACFCIEEGECSVSNDNYLGDSFASSNQDCYHQCSSHPGCNFYTYYDSSNEQVHDQCVLLSSCSSKTSCGSGCHIGDINCNITIPTSTTSTTSTTPTTTVTSTTTTAPNCDDVEYFTLGEQNRNKESPALYPYHSDNEEDCHQNGEDDWRGTGWYRMVEPAGTMIPESKVDQYQCGTPYSGWLAGSHPSNPGEEVSLKVCFRGLVTLCEASVDVKVRNCGDFFLYYLPDTSVIGSDCLYRYCAE